MVAGFSGLDEIPYPGGTPFEGPFGKGSLVTKTEGIEMNPPPYALPSNPGENMGITEDEAFDNGPWSGKFDELVGDGTIP